VTQTYQAPIPIAPPPVIAPVTPIAAPIDTAPVEAPLQSYPDPVHLTRPDGQR